MADKDTPMGGNMPEESVGHAEALSNRNCWAIDVLVEEVTALFKTEVETSEPNHFNANKVVQFTPEPEEWDDLSTLLAVVGEDDERVVATYIDKGQITITITPDPILMDTRTTFGIDSAYLGLDRELTPEDMTELAADLAAGGEGFTEGSA